jgi:HEAT repeat protein
MMLLAPHLSVGEEHAVQAREDLETASLLADCGPITRHEDNCIITIQIAYCAWYRNYLVQFFDYQDINTRQAVIRTIGILAARNNSDKSSGSLRHVGYALLRRATRAREESVRLTAIRAIRHLRTDATASAELNELVSDSSRSGLAEAIETICCFGLQQDSLVRLMMDDPDTDVRVRTVQALGRIGDKSLRTRSALEKGLADTKWEVRLASIEALDRIGAPIMASTVAGLEKCLADPHNGVRMHAILALRKMGCDVAVGIEELMRNLDDRNIGVRLFALQELANLGHKSWRAVPRLCKLLGDEDLMIRAETARTLGSIGMVSVAAIPKLRAALKDKSITVRLEAKMALDRIEAEANDQ